MLRASLQDVGLSGRPRRFPAAGRCGSRSPSCSSVSPITAARQPRTSNLGRNSARAYLNACAHRSSSRSLLPRRGRDADADLALRTLTDYHTNYSGYLADITRIEALRRQARAGDDVARQDVHRPVRYQATKAGCRAGSRCSEWCRSGNTRAQEDPLQLSAACIAGGWSRATARAKGYSDLVVFADLNLHIEPETASRWSANGVGESTLMRMLSGEEARTPATALGHGVVMRYFAQRATRIIPRQRSTRRSRRVRRSRWSP